MIDYNKIKQDVADALEGALPTVQEISVDKILPNEFEDLPSVSIYTLASGGEGDGISIPFMFQTSIDLILDVIVSQNTTYMTEVTDIINRILERLFSETPDDWFTANDINVLVSYQVNLSANSEGGRETVVGEIVITLQVCEQF